MFTICKVWLANSYTICKVWLANSYTICKVVIIFIYICILI